MRPPGGEAGAPEPAPETALVLPPEIVAVLTAAAALCWPKPVRAGTGRGRDTRNGPEYVWRLSGRWWSKPVPLRRDRPWTDHGREHGQVDTGGA